MLAPVHVNVYTINYLQENKNSRFFFKHTLDINQWLYFRDEKWLKEVHLTQEYDSGRISTAGRTEQRLTVNCEYRETFKEMSAWFKMLLDRDCLQLACTVNRFQSPLKTYVNDFKAKAWLGSKIGLNILDECRVNVSQATETASQVINRKQFRFELVSLSSFDVPGVN